MTKHANNILLAVVLILFASCKNDDYHYPDLLTDLVEADTDGNGFIKLIRTDDQKVYHLSDAVKLEGATPDSTYRARGRFELKDEYTVTLYGLSPVISPDPENEDYFKGEVKNDPVKITSVWKTGNYINLHLGVMTKQEATHKFHFVKYEIQELSGGHHAIDISLYHDRDEDSEAFTKELFLSCPLYSLELNEGDSIRLLINTYEGERIFRFAR